MADKQVFESVPRRIRARRMFVDSYQQINGKQERVPAGMWIIEAIGGNGGQVRVPDDVFREQFRPTDTASEALWKETTNAVYPHWPDGRPIVLS